MRASLVVNCQLTTGGLSCRDRSHALTCLVLNPRFGLVLAVLYALLAWPLVDESASPGKNSAPDFLEVLGQMLAQLPGVLGFVKTGAHMLA